MKWLERFKPEFLHYLHEQIGLYKSLFDFRSLWRKSIVITLVVSLLPLFALAIVDYRISKSATESEILLRTARVVSNARRSLIYYMDSRRLALNFILRDNTFAQLREADRLNQILAYMRKGVGDWSDLGLIDKNGIQVNYSGPYEVQGRSYTAQPWYQTLYDKKRELDQSGDTNPAYTVSDVFLGYRHVPHLVLAVLGEDAINGPYTLVARLGIDSLAKFLADLEIEGDGDAFLINQSGIVQTPSKLYGEALSKSPLSVPPPSEHTQVQEIVDKNGRTLIIGYAYITGTPFILMVVKHKKAMLDSWRNTISQLFFFLLISVFGIVVVVFGICTYLVNSIYQADQRRLASLHQVEYSNKMASIGRLSAGVAHEINNPLAIINEKAGLIKDLFTFRKEYAGDERLLRLIDAIIQSVDRCATITRQMLNFARNSQASIQQVSLEKIVADVLELQRKEAVYRGLAIDVDIDPKVTEFSCDRGKLQQIFINLINNAFAAMKEGGGKLVICSYLSENHEQVITRVSDTGCGIPPENLEKIFEPFFTTKSGSGGTGLGLSITYGLVQDLGGEIDIESKVGEGTTFTIILPLSPLAKKGEDTDARTLG